MHSKPQNELLRFVLVLQAHGRRKHLSSIVIQVERSTDRHGVGLFLSRAQTKGLYHRLSPDDRKILPFLNCFAEFPPFEVPLSSLRNADVIAALRAIPRIFVRRSRYGSLTPASERDKASLLPQEEPQQLLPGQVVYGELVVHPTRTQHVMEVFFRYRDIPFPVRPGGSHLPLSSLEGKLFARDVTTECSLLGEIANLYDSASETLRINITDLHMLSTLNRDHWRVLAQVGHKHRNVSMPEATGIDWFGKNSDTQSIDRSRLRLIVDAYLHDRPFVELGGELILLPGESVVNNADLILGEICESPTQINLLRSLHTSRVSSPDSNVTNTSLHALGFLGELRNYQLEGVEWMQQLREIGLGGILADEMGLGKTVQTLAHLRSIKQAAAPHLVVTPASVVPNWQQEIHRFTPDLRTHLEPVDALTAKGGDIVILSYQKLIRNFEVLKDVQFDTVVLDEGQVAKNERTRTSHMTRRLLSSHRLVLTGTPIENSLHELWSHVVFLNPGFSTLYRRLTSRIPGFSKSPQAAKLSGALLKPLILRRTKDEVEKDLPPRYEEIVFCDLSNSEKTLYENIRAGFIHMFSSGVTARVASIALEGLLRLRQTCSLPAMLPHSLNPHRVTRCSKLALTQKLLLDHAPMGKTIVFCQFTSVLDALQRHLCDKGVVYERLDGATRDRSERIKRFQQNPLVRVFLISFRAGGVGINLTAADRVILYEPWWNPAAEEQSFARAHRIGQTKSVLVQRLICRDTVEEKILALREKKKTLALDTYSSSQQLSVDELKEMLT